jgi:hypothetical protein
MEYEIGGVTLNRCSIRPFMGHEVFVPSWAVCTCRAGADNNALDARCVRTYDR